MLVAMGGESPTYRAGSQRTENHHGRHVRRPFSSGVTSANRVSHASFPDTFAQAERLLNTLMDRSRTADGVVLDIHLADSDEGWELAELIPLIGAPPPRIVFSTGMPDAIPERIAALGPVLTKPYDPAELVRALRANSRPGLLARIRSTLR